MRYRKDWGFGNGIEYFGGNLKKLKYEVENLIIGGKFGRNYSCGKWFWVLGAIFQGIGYESQSQLAAIQLIFRTIFTCIKHIFFSSRITNFQHFMIIYDLRIIQCPISHLLPLNPTENWKEKLIQMKKKISSYFFMRKWRKETENFRSIWANTVSWDAKKKVERRKSSKDERINKKRIK